MKGIIWLLRIKRLFLVFSLIKMLYSAMTSCDAAIVVVVIVAAAAQADDGDNDADNYNSNNNNNNNNNIDLTRRSQLKTLNTQITVLQAKEQSVLNKCFLTTDIHIFAVFSSFEIT